jgi:hypothetical protein
LRKLGLLGWFLIAAMCLFWYLGEKDLLLALIGPIYSADIPSLDQFTAVIGILATGAYSVVFLIVFKLISGHSFGFWPKLAIEQPKSLMAFWIGLGVASLVGLYHPLLVYFLYPDWPAQELISIAVEKVVGNAAWCLVGLCLAYLHKRYILKVKNEELL